MRTNQYTEAEDALMRERYATATQKEMEALLPGRTWKGIKSRAQKLGLKRQRMWTAAMDEELRRLYPRHTAEECAKVLGVKRTAIMARTFKLRIFHDSDWMLEKSRVSAFKKGHSPSNKGKKWSEYMTEDAMRRCSRTQFRKGTRPPNWKPTGSRRLSKDGYVEVKVAEPNRWEHLHRLVWMEHHGEIPDGMHVCFIDGNKENVEIGNLKLMSVTDKFLEHCSIHTRMPPELVQLIQLKGAIKRQLNKAEGKQSKKKKTKST